MSKEGLISVRVAIDSLTGKVAAGPEITARGVVDEDVTAGEVGPKLEAALAEAISRGVRDTHELQQVVRRAVGGWVGRKIRRRPMIIPTVIES